MSDAEFKLFQRMIYDIAGINMSPAKKALVGGRLARRIKHHNLSSYGAYFELLRQPGSQELQIAVDLLTTNETYFFREPKHFDFLRDEFLPHCGRRPLRVWSAASSSGEEAYTLAMVLAEHAATDSWEIVGTDISSRIVERARSGLYAMERTRHIPKPCLRKYCLKGVGDNDGTFLISRELRDRTRFVHANLKDDLQKLGRFDLVFLRNVLIYFDQPTKRAVVAGVLQRLNPGGLLLIGHSESLNGVTEAVEVLRPSIYRKLP